MIGIWISLGALLISAITFCLALKNQREATKIGVAERKTSILLKILEAKSRLEVLLVKMEKISESFKRREKECAQVGINLLQGSIQKLNDGFHKLEKMNISNLVNLEKSMPFAHKLLIDVETEIPQMEELFKEIIACEKKEDKKTRVINKEDS